MKDFQRSRALVNGLLRSSGWSTQPQAEADEVVDSVEADKAAIRTVQTNPDYTSIVAPNGAWRAPNNRFRNTLRFKVDQHAHADRRRACIHAVGEFVR
jgi:hypothetical protein